MDRPTFADGVRSDDIPAHRQLLLRRRLGPFIGPDEMDERLARTIEQKRRQHLARQPSGEASG